MGGTIASPGRATGSTSEARAETEALVGSSAFTGPMPASSPETANEAMNDLTAVLLRMRLAQMHHRMLVAHHALGRPAKAYGCATSSSNVAGWQHAPRSPLIRH